MNGKTYLIIGIVFLSVGITMLITGAVSRTMAYADLAIALVYFVLSARDNKESGDDKKDE